MNTEDLIQELRSDIKIISNDLHSINTTLAKLSNIQDEIRDIKQEIKDLPVIRSKVGSLIWGISVIYISLVGYVMTIFK